MKKRLRKKLRLGEFQELGFEVSFKFLAGLDEDKRTEFLEQAVNFADTRNLELGGYIDTDDGGLFVSKHGRGSVNPEDREEFGKWVQSRAELASCEVGNLEDCWYSV